MYRALAPGCLGFNKSFMESAQPAAEQGFEGYWFGIEGDAKVPAAETLETLAKYRLHAAGFTLPVEFRREEAVFEADLARLEDYAAYAAAIGAKNCITWLLPASNTLTYQENFLLHQTRLKKVTEVLKHHGIRLGLEFVGTPSARKNAKNLFIYRLDETLALCEAIDPEYCGLLLDIWHWEMAGHTRADFAKISRPSQIVLVHINDAPAGIPFEEQQDGVRRLPGDTGVFKISEFLDGIKTIGYTGAVLVEPFDKTLAELPFEKALEKTIAAINRVLPK